jgi:hypothetical protein
LAVQREQDNNGCHQPSSQGKNPLIERYKGIIRQELLNA